MSRVAAGAVKGGAASTGTRTLLSSNFEVFGKVQGVFFRKHTKIAADRLHLVGWCENTDAGECQCCITDRLFDDSLLSCPFSHIRMRYRDCNRRYTRSRSSYSRNEALALRNWFAKIQNNGRQV
jgi:hypothetical protein